MNDASNEQQARVLEAIRLTLVPGVGPRLRQTLIEQFGTIEDIFRASLEQLRNTPGIGPKVANAVFDARTKIDPQKELDLCEKHHVTPILSTDESYPALLDQIADPPGVLFTRGTIIEQDRFAIAFVGSRHATNYGKTTTERLAGSLARSGVTIVSGLARGIDGVAHQAALEAGGRTIAVLGNGLSKIYPPEHAELAHAVSKHGAVISEYNMLSEPTRGSFPQRNRIISGISLGVVVVEAASNSGALITARHATEQGREVFAVPGRIDSRLSKGYHRLIREGAKLVESVEDILEELEFMAQAASNAADETPEKTTSSESEANGKLQARPAEHTLNETERAVFQAISDEPTFIDTVITNSQLPPHQVLATLSMLELKHLIKRLAGNRVERL